MNAKFLNPANYFTVTDFPEGVAEPTYKILSVTLEDIEDEKGKVKRKGSIALDGVGKQWLANVTNVRCLVAMFGEETDRWVGKRVTVFSERVMAFGEWTLGVRLRGSPDLEKPVSVRIKLRKKREQIITMQRTGVASAPPAKGSTPYERMWDAWKAAGGGSGDAFKLLVKNATGKPTSVLVDADVTTFTAALSKRDAPPPIDDEEAAEIARREAAQAGGA